MSPSVPDCVTIDGGDAADALHHQPVGGDFLLALLARGEGPDPADRTDPPFRPVSPTPATGVSARGTEAGDDIPPGEFRSSVSTGREADPAETTPSPKLLHQMVLLQANLPSAQTTNQRQRPGDGDAGRHQTPARLIAPARDNPASGSARRDAAGTFSSPAMSGLFHPGALAGISGSTRPDDRIGGGGIPGRISEQAPAAGGPATGNATAAVGTTNLSAPASTTPCEQADAPPAAVLMQPSHEPLRIQAASLTRDTGAQARPRDDLDRLPADHAGRFSPAQTDASNATRNVDRSGTPRRDGSAAGDVSRQMQLDRDLPSGRVAAAAASFRDEASRTSVRRDLSDGCQGDEMRPSRKPSDADPTTSPRPTPDDRQSFASVLDAFMPGRSGSVETSTPSVADTDHGSGRAAMPSAGDTNASPGIAGTAARMPAGRHTAGAGATLSPSETQTLLAAFLDDLDGGASVSDAMAKYDPASLGFDPDATCSTIMAKLQSNPVLAQDVQTMLRDVAASGRGSGRVAPATVGSPADGSASRVGRLTIGAAAAQHAGTAPVQTCTDQTDAATNRRSLATGVPDLARGAGGITGVAMMLPEVSALWNAGALEHRAKAALTLKGARDAEVDAAHPAGRRMPLIPHRRVQAPCTDAGDPALNERTGQCASVPERSVE